MSINRFERPLAVQVYPPVYQWKLSSLFVSSKSWSLLCLALLIMIISCPVGHSLEDVDTILDKQEADIRTLADFVLQNYRNSAALAESCAVNCSRLYCRPLTTDNFVCGYSPDNPDCRRPDNSSCTSQMVDWSQSIVTGPIDANLQSEPPNCDMRKTICAQKQLDTQFFTKLSSKEDRSTNQVTGITYVGTSNGILRAYPAKEANKTACSNYEVRRRPWFVAATALAKDIVVMLDSGPSSGSALSVDSPGITVFAAMKNITSRMLQTLTYEDSISMFTLASVAQPVGMRTSVPNSGSINVNSSVFEALNVQIQGLGDPGQQSGMGHANLTHGLKAALTQFDENQTPNLKIVIFLTTGDFTGEYLDESLVEDIKASNVTVFIFRVLSTTSSGGNDAVTTLLQNATCVMNSGYGEQLYDRQNPYAILQPFYNYVARLRFDQNGQRPYWVTKFASYAAQGQVIAVAMPVFDGRVLVGVAVQNIFVDYLQNRSSNLDQVLSIRNTVSTLQLNNNRSITTLCGRVDSLDQSCPASLSGGSGVTGLCTNVNASAKAVDLLCCRDDCPWPFSGSGGGHGNNEALKIALPVSLSSAIFLIAAICVGYWLKRRKHSSVIITASRHEDRPDDMFERSF